MTLVPASTTSADTDAQLVAMWLSGKAPTSQALYRGIVRTFANWTGKSLREVTLADLQAWRAELEARYRPATVKTKLNAIKSLLSFAQRVGYVPFNAGSAISPPAAKDTLNERILSPDDAERLIAAPTAERNRVLLALLYRCGLRVSEACNLRWQDLVPRDRGGQATVYSKNKTRTVLVPEGLWQQLHQLPQVGEHVFTSCNGRPLTQTAVHYRIKDAARRAGITERVSPHWLRHSHATTALENGCSLHLLQQSLGHSSLAITGKYLHARPESSSSEFV